MHKRPFLNLFFFFALCISIIALPSFAAQGKKALMDSLQKELTKPYPDSVRLKILDQLSYQNFRGDPETSKQYARETKALAIKLNKYAQEAKSWNVLGVITSFQGQFDSAAYFYGKELAIGLEHNDQAIQLKTYQNMGLNYTYKGDFGLALEYCLKGLHGNESAHDSIGIAGSMANIGNIYYRMKSIDKALTYYKGALPIFQRKGARDGYANTLNAMGVIYSDKGENDKSLDCYQRSYKIKVETNDLFGQTNSLLNIATIYSYRKDYVHSLEFEKRALVLKKQLKDATGTAEVLTNLCSDSRRIKDFSNSIQYGLEAMRIADSIHSNFERLNAAESIALTYSKLGNYEKAYAYQQLFSELTDSVMSEKKNEQIARMQTQYDTEKKIQENVQLTQQNKLKDLEIGRQKMQRYIVIGSALFLMVLAFLLYSRYRVKQREILSAEIIRQQDMRSKAIIETEEKERIRISRDLHDGIGQTLSAAKLNMSALEGSLHLQNEDQRQNMKNAIELMDESIKEVRAVSHNMMPNALLKSGLGTAVREFLNRIGDTDKVKVDLQVVGMNERLESTTETILFRVLQELVANIVKHAKTGYIGIQLIRHEKELVLMIEDRGIGFDLKKLNDAAGMGLRNVQSRIAYLNGTVDFDSQPGKGTTVTIEIPLS